MTRSQPRANHVRALTFLACALLSGGAAQALTDEEIFRDFGFNFVNPGARALGMGGASVAVADDVTAVQANPAGLHYLWAPEIAVDFRMLDPDTRSFASRLGSLEVEPGTGARQLPFLGLTSVSDVDETAQPAFVGFALPSVFGPGGRRLTAAGSVRVLLSEDRWLSAGDEVTGARFAFDSFPNTATPGGGVEAYSVDTRVTGSSSAEILHLTAGVSIEASRDFSVGVTVTYATLDLQMSTVTRVIDPQALLVDPGHPRLPAQPTTDVFQTAVDDTDEDVAYTLGIHWHPDSIFPDGSSPWHFGAVYRKGTGFEVDESTFLNGVLDERFVNRIVVPDRFGIGVRYRPSRHWTLAADYERIEYSDMLEDFRSGVNYLTSSRVADGGFGVDPAGAVEFTVDDGDLPRLGVEYDRPYGPWRRLMLRAGWFRAPDSRIRMSRFNSDDPAINRTYLDAFRGGEAQDHFTAGAGVTFGRSAIHLAGDVSDDELQVVASYSFSLRPTRPVQPSRAAGSRPWSAP